MAKGRTSKPSRSIQVHHGGKRGKTDPGLEPHLSPMFERVKVAKKGRDRWRAKRAIHKAMERQRFREISKDDGLTPTARALRAFHKARELAKQFPELEPARLQKIARVTKGRRAMNRPDPFA